MGSVSTIYNGVRTWLAGRALMDVALSDRSTNGVQNKIIKAKFDEVDDSISQINSDLAAIHVETQTYDTSTTIEAGTSATINLDVSETGYTAIGIMGYNFNGSKAVTSRFNLSRSGQTAHLVLTNVGSDVVRIPNVQFDVLYVKANS